MQVETHGGKGYHLYLLSGFAPVPAFFVVNCDNNIDENEIFAGFDKLNTEKVAVRSSATIEDGKTASFAGMFDSSLNVKREGLIESIKEIASSCENERIQKYCELNGVDYSKCKMRVVVQKMVQSRISGVCITKPNEILIECCYGLGEALVSGKVTPDTYYIDRNTLRPTNMNISCQRQMLRSAEAYEMVPFRIANVQKMKDNEIIELSKIAIEIERRIGFNAADIEWAYEGDNLYILQAREFVGHE